MGKAGWEVGAAGRECCPARLEETPGSEGSIWAAVVTAIQMAAGAEAGEEVAARWEAAGAEQGCCLADPEGSSAEGASEMAAEDKATEGWVREKGVKARVLAETAAGEVVEEEEARAAH